MIGAVAICCGWSWSLSLNFKLTTSHHMTHKRFSNSIKIHTCCTFISIQLSKYWSEKSLFHCHHFFTKYTLPITYLLCTKWWIYICIHHVMVNLLIMDCFSIQQNDILHENEINLILLELLIFNFWKLNSITVLLNSFFQDLRSSRCIYILNADKLKKHRKNLECLFNYGEYL